MQPLSPTLAIFYSLVFIFVGWLLGLLSPKIVDAISKGYHRRDIKKAIVIELAELRVRLSMIAAQMAQRLGTYDRSFIEWQIPIVKSYKGFYSEMPLVEALQHISTDLTDEQIRTAIAILKRANTGFSQMRVAAPFLVAVGSAVEEWQRGSQQPADEPHGHRKNSNSFSNSSQDAGAVERV